MIGARLDLTESLRIFSKNHEAFSHAQTPSVRASDGRIAARLLPLAHRERGCHVAACLQKLPQQNRCNRPLTTDAYSIGPTQTPKFGGSSAEAWHFCLPHSSSVLLGSMWQILTHWLVTLEHR